ncbi:hypothetical protein BDQ17DRAFT_721836 [Cyathus striatus]|nr:hypothetical protein BDQ17DRAFT_721836 [Cyathus striatus]
MDTRLHQQQQRRQQIGHSRRNPSTSTEDTDPFPEVLSWAALIDVQTTLRSPQTIPSDVLSKLEDSYTSSFELTSADQEETETESEDESGLDEDDMSVLSSLFDPTTLHVGVDLTCLEGLDDELLLCPHDAFAAICWADAVRVRQATPVRTLAPSHASTPTLAPAPAVPTAASASPSPPSYEDALLARGSKTKYRPSPLNPSRSRHAHVISRFPTSDGSDSDSDDARTFTDALSPTDTTDSAASSTSTTRRSCSLNLIFLYRTRRIP